jgi:hypothetical protein
MFTGIPEVLFSCSGTRCRGVTTTCRWSIPHVRMRVKFDYENPRPMLFFRNTIPLSPRHLRCGSGERQG